MRRTSPPRRTLGALALLSACAPTDIVAELGPNAQRQDGGLASDGADDDASSASDARFSRDGDEATSDARDGSDGSAAERDATDAAAPEALACLGDIASRAFRYTVCSCADTTFQAAVTLDAFDSNEGAYEVLLARYGGSVATNGAFHGSSATFTINGDLIVADPRGMTQSLAATILGDLRLAGPLTLPSLSMSTVTNDLWLAGDLHGEGYMVVMGDVHQTVSAQRASGATLDIWRTDQREPLVMVPPPCPCGDAAIDVRALVAAGKQHAENAAAAFDAESMAAITTDRRIELPAGWLSASRIDASAVLTLIVNHKTALFVDGDVRIAGSGFALELGPEAELDLVVGGNFRFEADAPFGFIARPGAVRTYVAGEQAIVFDADAGFAANLYAPHADTSLLGLQAIYGSVVGKNVTIEFGAMHHDKRVELASGGCPRL